MKTPKISVLMPAYNADQYIVEAIESILNQTFTDFEFIIIDDCSTDKTWEIIKEYAKKDKRIIAIKNEKNLKLSATLNKGIDICKADYIARMDADDWSYPDRFKKQYEVISKDPKIGILGGTMEVCDEKLEVKNIRKYHKDDKEIRRHIFKYSPFCHATTMYRKNIVQDIGKYNINLYDAEDYDLYFRIGQISEFKNIDDTLYRMRYNENSVSNTRARRQEFLTIYIRLKSIVEYNYKMPIADKIYTLTQLFSMLIIPSKYKAKLFNFIRSKI
jgi:glycosyltransferase involved in cell wall biosynthesis